MRRDASFDPPIRPPKVGRESKGHEDPQLAEVPCAAADAVDLAHLFVLELALVPASKVVLALEREPQKLDST